MSDANLEIVARLLETMEHAIKAGDWKVDGACDPDAVMTAAEAVLRARGWVRNSVDGGWQ